jgi:hypothetical protein
MDTVPQQRPGYVIISAEEYVEAICRKCASELVPGYEVLIGCCEDAGVRTRYWKLSEPTDFNRELGYGTLCSFCDRRLSN